MNESLIFGSLSKHNILELQTCLKNIINIKNKQLFFQKYDSFLSGNNQSLRPLFNMIETSNNISIEKKIVSGNYGVIFNCIFEDKQCILKTYIQSLQKYEFLQECLTHVLLLCLHSEMEKILGEKFRNPFPKIYYLTNTEINNEQRLVCCMEKLDFTLLYFFEHVSKKNQNEEFTMIREIAKMLYTLQKSLNFVHRDLHAQNIMIKKVDVKRNGKIKTYYFPYIIDLGMVCLQLNFSKQRTDIHFCDIFKEKCFNCDRKDIDIKILIDSLLYSCSGFMSKNLLNYLKTLLSSYKNKTKIQHYFYFHDNTIDPSFYPENIMKSIDNGNYCKF